MSTEKGLLEAVREGDKGRVARLLQADLRVKQPQVEREATRKTKLTALKLAIQTGDIAIIGVFKKYLPELFKSKDEEGQTVLHWAVQANNHHSIWYLCRMPEVEKNAYDNEERTPLFYAVEQQNVELIDLLFTCGVSKEVGCENGKLIDIGKLAAFLGYQDVLTYAFKKKWVTQPDRIYYAAYWHDRHVARDQTSSDYVNAVEPLLLKSKSCFTVFWQGLSDGLQENHITGEKLILSRCFLTNQRLQKGLKQLGQLPHLTHLDLSYNDIRHWGISKLLKWLKNTPKLTHLDLSGHRLDAYVPPKSSGAMRLSKALPSLQALQTLKLAECGLQSPYLELLTDKIQTHPTLTHVNFNANEVKNDSALLLAKTLLKPSSHLRILHLADNSIEEAGALKLLEALSNNSTLTELTLTNISEDILGPMRWQLVKNGAQIAQPKSRLSKETIREIHRRLLLWETVCHAWHRYAEALDEQNSTPEEQKALRKAYTAEAKRCIRELSPSVCEVRWGEKMPDKPMPNTYYIIRENHPPVWALFYVEELLPASSGKKIPCETIPGLKERLAALLTEPMENIRSSDGEIRHLIVQHHTQAMPNSAKNLRIFHDHLAQGLEKLFIAFFCVGSKVMETSVSTSIGLFGKLTGHIGDTLCGIEVPKEYGMVVSIIGVALNVVSAGVNLLGKVVSSIGAFLQFIDKLRQQNDLGAMTKIGTRTTFEVLAKQLALHLTIMYQHQVFALSSLPAKERTWVDKTVHHPLKPSLEEFAEFMLVKIGLRCIAGEAVKEDWTFTHAITTLSRLVTTPHSPHKEKFLALLHFHTVCTEKNDYLPEEIPWALHALCTQTALFHYTGHYYMGPFKPQRTDVETFGCIYVRAGTDTKLLQPARFSPHQQRIALLPPLHPLFQKFLGDNLSHSGLALGTPYPREIIDYLMVQLDNRMSCMRVVLTLPPDPQTALDVFEKAIESLVELSDALKRPAVFISPMPQKAEHLIAGLIYAGGLIYEKGLLLFNPLGGSTEYPEDFRKMLSKLKHQAQIDEFGLMKTRLCKSGYDQDNNQITATSSDPIIVELIRFLTDYTFEELMETLKACEISSSNDVDLSPFLAASPLLTQLDKVKNRFAYRQTLTALRQSHYELLQQWVLKEGRSPIDEEKSEKFAAQTVFDRVMAGMGVEDVVKLDCYKQLKKALETIVPSKLATQVKSLEERIVSLEAKGTQFDSDMSGMKSQIQKIQTTLATGKLPPELQSQLQGQINALSQQVGELETRINGKISELETGLQEQKAENKDLKDRVGELEKQIKALKKAVYGSTSSTDESANESTQEDSGSTGYGGSPISQPNSRSGSPRNTSGQRIDGSSPSPSPRNSLVQ